MITRIISLPAQRPRIHLRGAGFCSTMGRLMTVVTSQIVPVILVNAGADGVVTMLRLMAVQAIAVAALGIETRQQPLEALRPGPVKSSAIEAALPRWPRN
jgi:putative MFS transporter